MTQILSIQSKDGSDEIFSSLRGKKFFAICIEENGKHVLYQNKINLEEIIYASNLVIHQIMSEDLIK